MSEQTNIFQGFFKNLLRILRCLPYTRTKKKFMGLRFFEMDSARDGLREQDPKMSQTGCFCERNVSRTTSVFVQ